MSCRVAIYHSTHSWLQAAESSLSQPSCAVEMFYKLIILLSGSSTVLLCSLHATSHLGYTHISPAYNRAWSTTFVIWCFRSASSRTSTGEAHMEHFAKIPKSSPLWLYLKCKAKIKADTYNDCSGIVIGIKVFPRPCSLHTCWVGV